jgi:hypothetical protein
MTQTISQPKTPQPKWQTAQRAAEALRDPAGNRHERRKIVAWKRGKYMRDKNRAAQLESDLRRDAIADRVERKQGAAHARALIRKARQTV